MREKFERFEKYMKAKGLNDNQVTSQCGLAQGLLSQARKGKSDLGAKTIDKILNTYQDINKVWLLTGHGEMLLPLMPTIINGVNVVNGNNSGHISQVNVPSTMPNTPIEDAEAVCLETGAVEGEAVEFLPVVPAKLAQLPHEDTWAYINQNPVPRQPVVMQFPDYHTTLQVRSDAMAPRLRAGDTVALRHMGPNPKIMNGEVYGFDTRDGGLVIREGTNIPGGYRLHARSERYADDVLMYEEVLNVYEVVGAVIMNI